MRFEPPFSLGDEADASGRKVLIVSPNWPPVSCPDLHRVRVALPFFREFGWEPLIVKIDPDEQEGIKDPDLLRTVPAWVRVWQSGCLPRRWTSWAGVNGVALRSFSRMARLGDYIIRAEKPELVFFSTTMFLFLALGPYWKRRHGVDYVCDLQDPWLTDYYRGRGGHTPPGGRFKYGLSRLLAKTLEPSALKGAARVISVSPSYPGILRSRYPGLGPERFTVLPFAAAERDFRLLAEAGSRQSHFDRRDGKLHWVYAGCVGEIMEFSLRCFFLALKRAREKAPGRFSRLLLHFIGTDYAPGERARQSVEPLAAFYGVGDLVREQPRRVPYFEALGCLLDADALIVPGSDDPGYTASKIFPYILADKPLLAIFHRESSVVEVLERTGGGTVVSFASGEAVEEVADRIGRQWFEPEEPPAPRTDWEAFAPYTAREMTRRLCACFDSSLEPGGAG